MTWEWILAGFVWLGVRKRVKLRDLIGGRWASARRLLLDVVIAGRFWMVAMLVLGTGAKLMHLDQAGKYRDHAPATRLPGSAHTASNSLVWFCLSATAGFCEEIIFRGYLQLQFAAITSSMLAGSVALGGGVRRVARLRRRCAHAADRNFWSYVWIAGVVAQEPSSRNDRARMARRLERRGPAHAEITSVHAGCRRVR